MAVRIIRLASEHRTLTHAARKMKGTSETNANLHESTNGQNSTRSPRRRMNESKFNFSLIQISKMRFTVSTQQQSQPITYNVALVVDGRLDARAHAYLSLVGAPHCARCDHVISADACNSRV